MYKSLHTFAEALARPPHPPTALYHKRHTGIQARLVWVMSTAGLARSESLLHRLLVWRFLVMRTASPASRLTASADPKLSLLEPFGAAIPVLHLRCGWLASRRLAPLDFRDYYVVLRHEGSDAVAHCIKALEMLAITDLLRRYWRWLLIKGDTYSPPA